jgi:hypothetical protein
LGFLVTNHYGIRSNPAGGTAIHHRPEGAMSNTYALRCHNGSQGLETTTPSECTATQWDAISAAAAQSQSAFDGAVAAVWPVWYGQRTTAQKAALRDVVRYP